MTESAAQKSDLIFELGYPDGSWVRIYRNGHVDGVPSGTIIINWFQPLLNLLQAQRHSDAIKTTEIKAVPHWDDGAPTLGDLMKTTDYGTPDQ